VPDLIHFTGSRIIPVKLNNQFTTQFGGGGNYAFLWLNKPTAQDLSGYYTVISAKLEDEKYIQSP